MSVPAKARDLPALATEINAEHEAAEKAINDSLQHARRCGELLVEAKGKCEHGEWGAWLETNFRASARTARGYMRVAGSWEILNAAKRQRVADLPLREALGVLADSRDEFEPRTRAVEPTPPTPTPAPKPERPTPSDVHRKLAAEARAAAKPKSKLDALREQREREAPSARFFDDETAVGSEAGTDGEEAGPEATGVTSPPTADDDSDHLEIPESEEAAVSAFTRDYEQSPAGQVARYADLLGRVPVPANIDANGLGEAGRAILRRHAECIAKILAKKEGIHAVG